ncbi:MAG: hypothetical protein AB1403_24365 [Candidatus Riflebacteria bacterium]
MLIQIKPTTESGLSHDEFSLDLIGRLDFNLPRAKKTQVTLDGSTAITLWKKQKQGAYLEKEFLLSPEKFEILQRIVYHSTVFEWLVFNVSDRLKCSIDITNLEPRTVFGNPDYKQVTVSFLITEVL